MKIRFAIAAATAALALSSAANAAEVSAKLAAPLAAPKTIVAGGAIFSCQADTCIAGAPSVTTWSHKGCVQLVKAVGAVSTYASGARGLDQAQLAACNVSARK